MLKQIKENGITKNDFQHFTYEEKDIEEQFFTAINQGYYIEALSILESKEWHQKTKNSLNKNYFTLYRTLLIKIKKELNINNSLKRTKDNNKFELPAKKNRQLIVHINNLKKLIQKEKYNEAYLYYQQNNLDGICEELDKELQIFLPFLNKSTTKVKKRTNNKI